MYRGSQELIFRGKSSAYKGFQDVDDEEGDMSSLANGKLKTTPSILLSTNQGNENREKTETPDWFDFGFSLVPRIWTPSILCKKSLTLNPCPNMGIQRS